MSTSMTPDQAQLVILDRDGVINIDSSDYVRSSEQWQPIEGSIEAIAQLSKAGFRIFVVTNQSGLARGYFSADALQAMHDKMIKLVHKAGGRIEKVFHCPHGPDEGCDCRKPATGMLEQLEHYLGQPVAKTWLVGDSLKDIQLAHAKQCNAVLVRTGNGLETEQQLASLDTQIDQKTSVFDDLAAASEMIIKQQKPAKKAVLGSKNDDLGLFTRFSLAVRAVLFYLLIVITLLPVSLILTPLSVLFSFTNRYQMITSWNRSALWCLKVCCGISHSVHGADNIPKQPFVVMAKHQSAWETIYLQTLFTPLSTILKRELLLIPFFGWGLAMLKPIAIKRSSPKGAIRQVQTQGVARLKDGIAVLVFPEGTRTHFGQVGRYARGGAHLAIDADVPILPLAHNAGKYWPKKGFLKYPGVIQVEIGEPIHCEGRTAAELTDLCQEWIESTVARMPD
ncbi:MAG: D-glycero-beta-D-manno-heptose 1,7-bisphosphate 7-phosphatase [Pseudomonadales bacterium]